VKKTNPSDMVTKVIASVLYKSV